jgi:Bacterial protein of unknown function (DUF937)
MATNLVSVVMQFLTPDVIAKIASALGLDRDVAQKMVGGAIPAILASMAGVAASPGGARQLATAVAQQQPGTLDNLKSLIGQAGQQSFASAGSSALSGLLGGGALDALTQSVAKFGGVGESTGKSLLGILGPVVVGALGQQQRSAGLDANGLASLLTSQKDQFAAAIPSGLADRLGSPAACAAALRRPRRRSLELAVRPKGRLPERIRQPMRRKTPPLMQYAPLDRRNGPIGRLPSSRSAVSPGTSSPAPTRTRSRSCGHHPQPSRPDRSSIPLALRRRT